MFFEANLDELNFNINSKGYNINFKFLIDDKILDVISKDNYIEYLFQDYSIKIINIDRYINININSKIDIDKIKFEIQFENNVILIQNDSYKFITIDNESILIINYVNLYIDNEFKDVLNINFNKIDEGYSAEIGEISSNSRVEIGMSADPFTMASAPGIMSVSAPDRNIYRPSQGDTSFSIYLFQGFYSNPDTGEQVIDYPLDTWNGVQVAGTIPISSALIGNDSKLEESFNKGFPLDSITIYIEFVANHQIGIDGFSSALYYNIIPPTDTALHFYNQQAIFIGNINGVSVYRGQYTIHKQSVPTYVDGIYKITFRIQKSLYAEMLFSVLVQNIYTIVGISSVGDSSISP